MTEANDRKARTLDALGQVGRTEFRNHFEIRDGFAYIEMGVGFPCVVDEADLPKIMITKNWRAQRHRDYPGLVYATCSAKGVPLMMHRVLVNAPKGLTVDHIDGDGLNNRSANLRIATYSQNSANEVAYRNNRVGARGVTFVSRNKTQPYKAEISSGGKRWYLGSYPTKAEAAAARIGAEKVLHGEFSQCK